MKPIYFSLSRVEEEENKNLDRSKLLGIPVCPAGFLDDKLDDEDYYIGQINLEEIAKFESPLPKKGFLYFFVNVDTYGAKVLYTDEEPTEAIADINASFDEIAYGSTKALYMDFDEDLDEGCCLFSDQLEDLDLQVILSDKDYQLLLLLDSLFMPECEERALLFTDLAPYDGFYVFAAKGKDIKNKDFSKVRFIDWGD